MAPVMELETASERFPEIDRRDRVLIAAAVAAVAGAHFRILEITPVSEGSRSTRNHPGPYLEEGERACSRRRRRARAQGGEA